MAKSELTVTINAKLDVDRKTAETCLRLVEAFVNANPVDLTCHKQDNGELAFEYHTKTFVVSAKEKEKKREVAHGYT